MKNQKELDSQLQTKITLAYATKTLIERFDFETKTIWDPFATSNGDIAKTCIDAGYDVFSTNVVEFNWKLDMKLDYFKCSKMPSRTGLSDDETDDFANGDRGSYGYKQIGDFAVAFCNGCGDWEWPAVNFVLYIGSDNKIHAYTPTEGNTYNKITGTAYSNSLVYSINKDKLDKWFKFALENGFIEDYDESEVTAEDFYCSGEKYDEFIENVIKSENINKMIEDIKKNIIVMKEA